MSEIIFDYFYGDEADQFTFFRVPKLLVTEERFKKLSYRAMILYGLLLDRQGLSQKNGWFDDQNRVFIIFTVKEAMEVFGISDKPAMKAFRELEECGLIERKKQGQGKPSLIYLRNFTLPRSESRLGESSGSIKPSESKIGENSGSTTRETSVAEPGENSDLIILSNSNTDFSETERSEARSAARSDASHSAPQKGGAGFGEEERSTQRRGEVESGKGSAASERMYGEQVSGGQTFGVYGLYDNVRLTEREYASLAERIPDSLYYIDRLSKFMHKTDWSCPTPYKTILDWYEEDKQKQFRVPTSFASAEPQPKRELSSQEKELEQELAEVQAEMDRLDQIMFYTPEATQEERKAAFEEKQPYYLRVCKLKDALGIPR